MSIAAKSEMITHTIATVADFLIIFEFLIDINLTRICGIPK